jgi:hypothetical protein
VGYQRRCNYKSLESHDCIICKSRSDSDIYFDDAVTVGNLQISCHFLCANLAPFWKTFMAPVYFVAKETCEA